MLELTINGERRSDVRDRTLQQLIEGLDLPDTRIAVELNRSVIRRSEWAKTELRDADVIEIVHFVGGG